MIDMNVESEINGIMDKILELSQKIYDFAETGSEEVKSSRELTSFLEKEGFHVERNYMNMNTAFLAKNLGRGPMVGLLAEYDALPNGHSCGHNLIAAWAAGTAAVLNKVNPEIKIAVFGTPSEEGIGPMAGSKCIMADKGAFKDVDFVIGVHPDDRWAVGAKALADMTLELRFRGKSAHGADSPHMGINALDAAVATYNVINSLRGWAKLDKHLVVGMIFTEGGKATNVIPEKAVLQVEMRSTSVKFLKEFVNKVTEASRSIGEAYGAKVEAVPITPFYMTYINNNTLSEELQKSLKNLGMGAPYIEREDVFPSGSTDEANVSQFVPTGHIDFPIGYEGIPGHSDEFRDAADPKKSRESLKLAIHATVETILSIEKNKLNHDIRMDFEMVKQNGNEL
jgi:amidohydrolase